jgi:mycothiol system anti-sigma-R factor
VTKELAALRCAGVRRFVDTYLDGEFAESDRVELEQHLESCDECRAHVKAQADWKAAVKAAAPREAAPAALRNRIQRSIARESSPARAMVRAGANRRWAAKVLPMAAAAGVLGTLIFSRVSFTPVAADVIAKHSKRLPLEVAGDPAAIAKWYADKLDFRFQPPPLAKAALQGGRLSSVGDHQAAYLVYDLNHHKVSVFVFDASDLPIEAHQKRVIGNREVYFDEGRGYNVAMYRDRGVGYAIASDMDPDKMYELVSSAVTH